MERTLRPLSEAFQHPTDSQVQVTSCFVDVVGSTSMQQNEAEASWVPQFGWFYSNVSDLIGKLTAEVGDHVDVKYLGDGIMVTVGARYATQLVNFAIGVQEVVCRASRPDTDGGKGRIDFNVSIGVVSGKAYMFEAPDGLIDYVGKTISTARRLCDMASARAIFIDKETERACIGNDVQSDMSRAHRRTEDDVFGELTQVTLKGLNNPIPYFEILWDINRFGVKGEVASSSSAARPQPMSSTPIGASSEISTPAPRAERMAGVVKSWNAERRFGFLTNEAGEDFYFNPTLLAFPEDADDDVPAGDRVAFMAIPPMRKGGARQAAVLLFDGERADGTISTLPNDERSYGWIFVEDHRGTRHFVYLPSSMVPAGAVRGSKVEFTVQVGLKGAAATKVTPVEPART